MYKESWSKLQQDTPQLFSYEDRALYSTWEISLQHVKRQSLLAENLLRLWAYFDNQDVWFELLHECPQGSPRWVFELTQSQQSFDAAIRVLCDHALLEADPAIEDTGIESRGYSMHACVHAWTIHVLNQEWDFELAGLALGCVGNHLQSDNARKPWVTQQRLLQHAGRCWGFVVNGSLNSNGRDSIIHSLSILYADLGRLDEAENMHQWALQGKEKALGPEHTSTLDTVNNLGNLYVKLGRLDEAEKMYQRALQGYKEALGPEHTSTLNTVNNLGVLYINLGRLDEAEKMYQRALQGREKALGPEHTSTLDTVNNLGNLYINLGRLDEAEKMYQRAL
jgi:tetratricopeptide (TPR) repeat protein